VVVFSKLRSGAFPNVDVMVSDLEEVLPHVSDSKLLDDSKNNVCLLSSQLQLSTQRVHDIEKKWREKEMDTCNREAVLSCDSYNMLVASELWAAALDYLQQKMTDTEKKTNTLKHQHVRLLDHSATLQQRLDAATESNTRLESEIVRVRDLLVSATSKLDESEVRATQSQVKLADALEQLSATQQLVQESHSTALQTSTSATQMRLETEQWRAKCDLSDTKLKEAGSRIVVLLADVSCRNDDLIGAQMQLHSLELNLTSQATDLEAAKSSMTSTLGVLTAAEARVVTEQERAARAEKREREGLQVIAELKTGMTGGERQQNAKIAKYLEDIKRLQEQANATSFAMREQQERNEGLHLLLKSNQRALAESRSDVDVLQLQLHTVEMRVRSRLVQQTLNGSVVELLHTRECAPD